MANLNIKLKNKTGDYLFPQTPIGNIVESAGSTVTFLDNNGKVRAEYLPSYVDDVVELLTVGTTAPATAAAGDMYYNETSAKIFTATAANTWSATGVDPEKGKIYTAVDTGKIYRWGGSAMFEISPTVIPIASDEILGGIKVGSHLTINGTTGVLSVDEADAAGSTVGAIAIATQEEVTAGIVTGKAVTPATLKTELDKKQGNATGGNGIDITDNTISADVDTTASNGISLGFSGSTDGSKKIAVTAGKASTSAFGVVKVSDTESNGVALGVSDGVVSVTASVASTSAFGVVKASTTASNGVSLGIADGVISASASLATDSAAGTVQVSKTASNGVALNIASGVVSATAALATASTPGTVQVSTAASNGISLGISEGVVSVSAATASTSATGVVALADSNTTATGTDTTKAVTPKGLIDTLGDWVQYEEI